MESLKYIKKITKPVAAAVVTELYFYIVRVFSMYTRQLFFLAGKELLCIQSSKDAVLRDDAYHGMTSGSHMSM
jgi:hypothetical protein